VKLAAANQTLKEAQKLVVAGWGLTEKQQFSDKLL